MQTSHHRYRRQPRHGVALVVVLFAVALVSIVVLAYFNLALLNRNISFSSAGQARANILALSALNFIKGDFIAEIQAGSTQEPDPTGANVPIYLPTTNATMLPYRMTTNVAFNASTPANLIKWSSGSVAFWTNTAAYANTAGPKRGASGITSTTSVSVNGRFVGASRWTMPKFGTSSSLPSAVTPEWVYMTRQGPLTNTATALSTLANPATGNTSYVVGRYAYVVYDEGGLININAAGYSPTTFSADPTDIGRKGSQGFADLTQIGLTTAQIDQLVGWRNATTWSSTAAYTGYLTTNATASGFLQPVSGDQAFLSRQDLINYCTTQLTGTPGTAVLPYLTTFSREKNAPSWGPEHNAYDPSAASTNYWRGMTTNTYNPTNTTQMLSYAYRDNQNTTNAVSISTQFIYNRFFPNVRVTSSFTRLSGETATVGEPLVKNRFDLNKLAWITYNNTPPTGIQASDILNYFGLTRNSDGSWTYSHGDSSRILRLDEVAAAKRDPDLFELVQAAILQGGLGFCSGDPTQPTSSTAGGEFARLAQGMSSALNPCPIYRYDKNGQLVYAQEKYQVVQIIANMIDQYDTDNYPTEIILNGEHFYGVENLPYISAVGDTTLRPLTNTLTYPTGGAVANNSQYQGFVHRWLTFSLWNPHQNAANPPATGPSNLRIFCAAGNAYPQIHNLKGYSSTPVAGTDYSGRIFEPPASNSITATSYGPNTQGPSWIALNYKNYSNYFSDPTPVGYSNSFTTPAMAGATVNMNDPDGRVATTLGWQRAGIYMGWSLSPDNTNKVSSCAPFWTAPQPSGTVSQPAVLPDPDEFVFLANDTSNPSAQTVGLTIYLQYQDSAGAWHNYEELRGLVHSRDGAGDAYMEPLDPEWSKWTTATKLTVLGSTTPSPYPPLAAYQESWVTTALDPRANRMNISTLRNGSANFLCLTNTWETATGLTTAPVVGPHIVGAGNPAGESYVNNLFTNSIFYTDRDFVTRVGDASGWTNATPLIAGNLTQRPLHLDRPFRSVAEIGYVFRDDPWKNLNLISANSADAALLDVFYIGSRTNAPSNLPPPNVIDGKMNIDSAAMNSLSANTKTSLPLQALLSQGLRYYLPTDTTTISTNANSVITTTEAAYLATNIVSMVQTNALMNVSDIPAALNQAPLVPTTPTGQPALKIPREAFVRALADSVDTRTWNLMIDVVAQAGRFSPTAANLNNFSVEGEKHYWLHVAIDRLTGEIVDQQLEPVWE